MISSSQIQTSSPIQFKTTEIQDSLKKTGTYIKDNFIIKQLQDFDQFQQEEEYIPPEEDYVFALQNKDPKAPFLGVVNYNFKREGYCLNSYLNGDIYFGNYNNDLRNKHGIYSFKPNKIETDILSQFYYGQWENDLFNGKGIYLWLKEKENTIPFSDYNNSNFDAFIGNLDMGKFKKGALLSKAGKNYFIYYGEFSEEGKKEGNKCFYYSANLEKICYGTFKNGNFIEGYVGNYNKEGKLSDLIAYKKEEGKKPEGEKIKLNGEEKITNILTKIREIILKKDYFKNIYDEFGKVLKFRDEKMNDINILMSEEYGKIVNIFKYNKITLCEDIEKHTGL